MPSLKDLAAKSVLVVLLSAFGTRGADAQSASGESRNASRAELQAALTRLESSVSSTAYSERIRLRARSQATAIRSRLRDGDFRVGDQIQLRVQGPTQLVDSTLTVGDSLILSVPGIRDVRLYGVLRSELEPVLRREVGEVVREPRIEARTLVRVAVLGAVATPGFHAVPTETLIDQLITLAGGPVATAALEKMQLLRGDTILFEDADVSNAIANSRTLGALDLQDGDVLMVPQQSLPWDRSSILQVASFFIGPVLTLLVVR